MLRAFSRDFFYLSTNLRITIYKDDLAKGEVLKAGITGVLTSRAEPTIHCDRRDRAIVFVSAASSRSSRRRV